MVWTLSAFADEAGGSMDEQIAALQKAGIDHIDLRSVDGINITELPAAHARQVAKKLDDASIRVGMFGSPIGKIDIADDFEIDTHKLEHLGEMKDIFGAAKVRLFSYYNKQEAEHSVWQAKCIDRLKRLTEIAARLDLVLYHENERHIFGDLVRDVGVIRDQCRQADPEHFKLIFDFDNYNQSGEDVMAAWRELGPATDAIHLKESKKQSDGTFQHVPVGTGDGHVPEILRDLADRGWEGPLTLEPHLAHSAAVMATGPSGQANQALKDMTPAECFQLAAEAAKDVLKQVGKR